MLGTVAGIAAATLLLNKVLTRQLAALPIALPHLQSVGIDHRALLFSAALCLVLACLLSLAPVLMARSAGLQDAVRIGQGVPGSGRSTRLFSVLIGAEAALAFVLLTAGVPGARRTGADNAVSLKKTTWGSGADSAVVMWQ